MSMFLLNVQYVKFDHDSVRKYQDILITMSMFFLNVQSVKFDHARSNMCSEISGYFDNYVNVLAIILNVECIKYDHVRSYLPIILKIGVFI